MAPTPAAATTGGSASWWLRAVMVSTVAGVCCCVSCVNIIRHLWPPSSYLFINARFCHDDAVAGHTVDRRKVVEVVCGICDRRQGVAASCEVAECGTVFGSAYFCGTCKLFDDEDKGQFHCDGCGICR